MTKRSCRIKFELPITLDLLQEHVEAAYQAHKNLINQINEERLINKIQGKSNGVSPIPTLNRRDVKVNVSMEDGFGIVDTFYNEEDLVTIESIEYTFDT